MIKIEKNKKDIVEIIRFIVEKYAFETEYDGRIESYCFYCDKYTPSDEDETHNEGCIYVKAKKILASLKEENKEMFLAAIEIADPIVQKYWYCIPCRRHFYVEAGYHSHKEGKSHKWKAKLYKEDINLWYDLKRKGLV